MMIWDISVLTVFHMVRSCDQMHRLLSDPKSVIRLRQLGEKRARIVAQWVEEDLTCNKEKTLACWLDISLGRRGTALHSQR